MKTLFLFLFSTLALFAQDIAGFWKTIDENTKMPGCVVAMYPYEDLYYGRIVATYNNEGKISETLEHPVERASGLVGDPYYCGLDLLWDLEDRGISYRGKVVDPKGGKVYNAEVWVENGNLIVRGKWLMFGRNQTWLPVSKSEFPKDFRAPDLKAFVPKIPEVK